MARASESFDAFPAQRAAGRAALARHVAPLLVGALLVLLAAPQAQAGDPAGNKGNQDVEALLSLVKEAQSATKNASVQSQLLKVADLVQRAIKEPAGSKDAIAWVQSARELLGQVAKQAGGGGGALPALVDKARSLAEHYLVGAPLPRPSSSGFPDKPAVYAGPMSPSAGVVEALFLTAATPRDYWGACTGAPVSIELTGIIRTRGRVGRVSVRFHSDAGDWDSPLITVDATLPGGYLVHQTLSRTDSWNESVGLVLVSPVEGAAIRSSELVITGRCGEDHPAVPALPRPEEVAAPAAPASPRVMTAFVPATHGFRFRNSFTNNLGAEVRTAGLCGGMVYGALDYYYAHTQIPQQDYRPATGTTLQRFIYGRQSTSIFLNHTRFAQMAATAAIDPLGSFQWGISRNGGLGNIRSEIDSGRPVPIALRALAGGISRDHQVLAIGYALGRYVPDRPEHADELRIFVYDPNSPGVIRELKPDLALHSLVYEHADGLSDAQWVTYFIDPMYVRDPYVPSVPEPDPGRDDGLVRELLVTVRTGDHHLSGIYDNLRATVNVRGRAPISFENINLNQVWIVDYDETVSLALPAPVRREDIESLVFQKALWEAWDVASVTIRARGGGSDRSSVPSEGFHLEGQQRTFSVTPTWVEP